MPVTVPARNARLSPDQVADADRDAEQHRQQQEDHHADDRNGAVLAVQIGFRAFLDGAGDLLHALAAGVRGEDRA
jgi:hypothetical protein